MPPADSAQIEEVEDRLDRRSRAPLFVASALGADRGSESKEISQLAAGESSEQIIWMGVECGYKPQDGRGVRPARSD